MVKCFNNIFNHHQFRQYLAVSIAALTFVTCGMILGWPSAVLPKLHSDNPPVILSLEEISWVISLMNISYILSPNISGFLMDKYGRKHTLLLMSILPISSWIIIIIGETALVLCVARFLSGLWVGVVYTVVPVYIAEITEPKFRSEMGTLISIMMYSGLLLTYVIGPLLSYKGIAIVSGIVPVIFFFAFLWIPESPVFYIIHKNHSKAAKSFAWFRGSLEKDKITSELESIEKSAAKDMGKKGGIKAIFKSKGTVKAFIITSFLAILQICSGIISIVVYNSATLPDAGFFFITKNQFIIVLGVILVTCTLLTTFLTKLFQNIQLLTVSSLGCAISMFIVGEWLHLKSMNYSNVQLYQWVPYPCFAFHAAFYSLGLGTIINTMKGELFPTHIRAISTALVTIISGIISFIQSKIYYKVAEVYGMEMNYWFNCVCCIACLIFVLSYVIETKDKSLEEIQEELEGNNK